MAFIHSAPGVTNEQAYIRLSNKDDTTDAFMTIPALQDMTCLHGPNWMLLLRIRLLQHLQTVFQ